MAESYKVYASKGYVDNKVPPIDVANQMLVTDASGNAKWVEQTHGYSVVVSTTLVETCTIVSADYGYHACSLDNPTNFTFEDGINYVVTWDGIEYNCTLKYSCVLGNPSCGCSFGYGTDYGNNEPFGLELDEYGLHIYALSGGEHTIAIRAEESVMKTLDEQYIPDTIARTADIVKTVNGVAPDENGDVVVEFDVLPVINGGTGQTSFEDTTPSTARYRASALVATETTPSVNGVINWQYE